MQRGANAQLIEEVLRSKSPRGLRPAEIRAALQQEKNMLMSFASLTNALRQLEARGSADQVDEGSWRYVATGV